MKRLVITVASIALLASGLYAPVGAKQTEPPPPTLPETVVLEDPFGDANGLNDQGNGGTIGFQGDNVTPADAGNASDIGKVWYSVTTDTVSAHIQTELPLPSSQALRYYVASTPGEGSVGASAIGCARFVALMKGQVQGQATTWQGENEAKFFDACNDGTHWFNNGVEATVAVHTLEDGTGVITITAPKDASPFLATGETLTSTIVWNNVAYGVQGATAGSAFYIDNTKPGIDYLIADPESEVEEEPKLPPGCKKGKGKKKGCKKKQ